MPLKRKSLINRKKALVSRKLLKSIKPLTTKKPLSAGTKTTEWDELRKELKLHFKNNLKIKKCEAKLSGCWVSNGLTFAHAKKRRYIKKDELDKVILCCVQCHITIEAYSHKDMKEFVEKIIESRVRGTNDQSS